MKKLAIHNPHLSPSFYSGHGLYNYIVNMINDEPVPYIFIDDDNIKHRIYQAIKRTLSVLHLEKFSPLGKYEATPELPFDLIWEKLIFSSNRLNSECDALISFNTHLEDRSVTSAVRRFDGLKIWDAGEYVWGEPASKRNKRFVLYGITHLMGYASHDQHCKFFQKSFPTFQGKVLAVPMGFTSRFERHTSFESRINKAVGVGTVNRLNKLNYPVDLFKESAEFYPDEAWYHRTRRKLFLNRHQLMNVLDSKFPSFPVVNDFNYDLVNTFNSYRMFVTCESIWYFPPAKAFEGSACGTVNVCINHECNREFGFIDGVNCIMYEEGNIDDFNDKVNFYQKRPHILREISNSAYELAHDNFSHQKIASNLMDKINRLS